MLAILIGKGLIAVPIFEDIGSPLFPNTFMITNRKKGIISVAIIRITLLKICRCTMYQGFYRKRPLSANLTLLALEWANFSLSVGFVFLRVVKVIIASSIYIGRIDTPLLAPGVGKFGDLELDNYPTIYMKDILTNEAHRHPYIELLGVMYLMKLRYGDSFGQRAGSCWRLIFVYALMPWMHKYRIHIESIPSEFLTIGGKGGRVNLLKRLVRHGPFPRPALTHDNVDEEDDAMGDKGRDWVAIPAVAIPSTSSVSRHRKSKARPPSNGEVFLACPYQYDGVSRDDLVDPTPSEREEEDVIRTRVKWNADVQTTTDVEHYKDKNERMSDDVVSSTLLPEAQVLTSTTCDDDLAKILSSEGEEEVVRTGEKSNVDNQISTYVGHHKNETERVSDDVVPKSLFLEATSRHDPGEQMPNQIGEEDVGTGEKSNDADAELTIEELNSVKGTVGITFRNKKLHDDPEGLLKENEDLKRKIRELQDQMDILLAGMGEC